MRSYAATDRQRLWKLQVPAALPYIFTALKISAAASVVGAIVGELPTGANAGLGRALLSFSQQFTAAPEKLYVTVIFCALAGAVLRRADQPDRAPGGRPRWHAPDPDGPPEPADDGRCARDDRGGGVTGTVTGATVPIAAVAAAGLGKVFEGSGSERVEALTDIDLSIAPGEFVSLIGPSGCGKSTLLRLIGDLLAPTAGSLVVNGKTPHQARLDRDYGIVFQQATLLDWRSVRRNVELPMELVDVPKGDRATPGGADARPGRVDRLRRPSALAALRWDAAAGGDRPRLWCSTRRSC